MKMLGQSAEELNEQLMKITPPPLVQVQKLVLTHLVYGCYEKTAEDFRASFENKVSTSDMDIDRKEWTCNEIFDAKHPAWNSLGIRKGIKLNYILIEKSNDYWKLETLTA
jgi:hypothetical protein